MLDASQLERMRQTNIETVDKSELVDINTIQIDAFAPIEERVRTFFAQVKNPYAFRVGNTAVKIEFADNFKSLNDVLFGYLSSLRQDC